MRKAALFFVAAWAAWAQTTIPAPIRVNAGGPAYTDAAGNVWAADKGEPNSYTTAAAITGSADPALYQTEAWAAGTLDYKFMVPNGAYTVTLKFAEIFFNAAGQRVFNIVINGNTVQANFDPFAAAGGANVAVDKTYPVTVAGGVIDIQLVSGVQNPKISAIDIEPVPAPAPITAPPTGITTTGTAAPPTVTTVTPTGDTQLVSLQAALASLLQQITAMQSIIGSYTACAAVQVPTPVALPVTAQ